MRRQLQRKPGTPLAQTPALRNQQLSPDVSVAEGGADEGMGQVPGETERIALPKQYAPGGMKTVSQ